MNNKLISVIVPVYNVEHYLNRCVDSILAQTYSDLEILLVDDGSTDNTQEFLKTYCKEGEAQSEKLRESLMVAYETLTNEEV